MTGIRSKVLIAGVAALALAGCGGSTSSFTPVSQTFAGSPSADAAGSPSSPPPALTCTTDISQGGLANGGPFVSGTTAQHVIGVLGYLMVVDLPSLTQGIVSHDAFNILDDSETAFDSQWASGQLATDAGNFVSDERAYDYGNDPSYFQPMAHDVLAMARDCPVANRVASQLARQAGM